MNNELKFVRVRVRVWGVFDHLVSWMYFFYFALLGWWIYLVVFVYWTWVIG